MSDSLHWNTVTPSLRAGLQRLMNESIFDPFRLVGGTSLSLQIGHRISVDLDLFTDAHYDTIDFQQIDAFLRSTFAYVHPARLPDNVALGIPYMVGKTEQESFKLDFYYTESFIFPFIDIRGIRLASKEELTAMKIDIVQRSGRKKDFWDLHALLDDYSLDQMIELHEKRYPYTHDATLIKANLKNFKAADEDFDPVCLWGKHWEVMKFDFFKMMNH